MKIKCDDCKKIKEGIPKAYNKFEFNLCFDCFQDRINDIMEKKK